jgi:ribonuclease HI
MDLGHGCKNSPRILKPSQNSGHAGLRGNERADYLARKAASYNTIIAYKAIPIHRGKQLLKEY